MCVSYTSGIGGYFVDLLLSRNREIKRDRMTMPFPRIRGVPFVLFGGGWYRGERRRRIKKDQGPAGVPFI